MTKDDEDNLMKAAALDRKMKAALLAGCAVWEDADVERFILGEHGIRVFLTGPDTLDPKDQLDLDGPIEAFDALPPELAVEGLAHRRDVACWLRGLRGEARRMAIAEARGELHLAPSMRANGDLVFIQRK
jgi:hypothetical protein